LEEGSAIDTLVRLDSYALSEADVVDRTWSFGAPGADRAYAPHLKLLPGGALGGHRVDVEWN